MLFTTCRYFYKFVSCCFCYLLYECFTCFLYFNDFPNCILLFLRSRELCTNNYYSLLSFLCVVTVLQSTIMELSHDTMNPTLVDGYPGPGSYVRDVMYDTTKEEIDTIISRARYCEQYIRYECYQSKLLTDAGQLNIRRFLFSFGSRVRIKQSNI